MRDAHESYWYSASAVHEEHVCWKCTLLKVHAAVAAVEVAAVAAAAVAAVAAAETKLPTVPILPRA